MAHCTWTYASDEGRNYNISLYHGPTTGHLLVLCNLKILLIDFSILQSKSYSFFLGEDLFVLDLERKGNTFYYNFDIDFDIDTPINRRRKALARKHWIQSLAFFGFLIACIFMFTSLVIKNKPDQRVSYSTEFPIDSTKFAPAKVFINEDGELLDVHYQFVAYNNLYRSRITIPDSILRIGMPLENGDEFKVYFSKYSPDTNMIDFNQPTENQILRYQKRTIEKHAALNENLPSPLAKCMVNVAYDMAGIKGLADFYFQNISPDENPQHNTNTYLRLTRDIHYNREKEFTCW